MFKIYNTGYKYNNIDIMASMILKYSWLDLIDMSLFAMFVVTCTPTSNIRVFLSRLFSMY